MSWSNLFHALKESSGKNNTGKSGSDGNVGIKYNKWMWLEAIEGLGKAPSKKEVKTEVNDKQDVEEEVRQLLVNNSQINGATLLNLLKSKGLKIVDEKPETGEKDDKEETTEADSGSSNTASVRGGVKKESASLLEIKFRATSFKETTNHSGTQKGYVFSTVLLMEGLGNLRDRYWYSREALESAIPIFEGKKIYADHPSEFDEDNRPERSVKDILGHFENVKVTDQKDGRCFLEADVIVLPEQQFDWARGLMKHSIEYAKKYPDKEFVGLSINASGDSEEIPLEKFMSENELPESCVPKLMKAKAEGVESINVVKVIENAVSIDLVTEPGAGGKILKLIEEEKMAKKANKKEADQKPDKEEKKGHGEGENEGKDGEHDDADQDKKLVKSMIKKHLGDKSDGSDEEEAMFKQAVEAYGEMGYESEDAHEAAGHAMKLSKHMADKKAEAEKEESEKENNESEDNKESKDESESEGKKESLESEVIALKAKVAKLQEKEAKIEIDGHVNSLCESSKMPQSVTKVFKAHVKEHNANTIKKVDLLWKTFSEAYKANDGSEETDLPITEKQNGKDGGTTSFADCKID